MPDLQLTISNQISNAAAQTTLTLQEAILNMKASGMAESAIRQSLLSDLKTGGPLFGGFKSKLRNTVKDGIEFSSNGSANGRFVAAGVERFQWVSVGDGKSCPDCEERHGETGKMEFFELLGLPGSGFSVCGSHCRCKLVPASYKGENLDRPLVKGKQLTEKDLQKKFYKNHHIGYKNKDGSIGGVNLSGNIKSDTELLNAIGSLEKDGYRVNWFGIEASGVSNRFSPLPGNTIASSTSTPIGHKLELSASVLRNRSKMKEMLKRNVDNEWFIRGGDTLKATIDHEFAHSVTISYGQTIINYRRAEFVKINRDYFNRFDELKQKLFKAKAGTKEWDVIFDELKQTKISNYAKESLEEFVAESFSMARNSTNPSEFALRVQELIDEIVKS